MSNNLGALDLITTSRDIVTQDLRGVFSFRYLASQLEEIQSVIGKMLLGDFKTYISSEIYKDIAHAKVRKKNQNSDFLGKFVNLAEFPFVFSYLLQWFDRFKDFVNHILFSILWSNPDIDSILFIFPRIFI